MRDWNPDARTAAIEDERTRPARDLLARVPLTAGRRAWSTWAAARAIPPSCWSSVSRGAQSSAPTTPRPCWRARAERLPQARFELSDIADLAARADAAPDLIYANAALQWVPDHETLIPRLFAALAPGGVLAIQMPDNREEPTHRLMRELAAQAPWAERHRRRRQAAHRTAARIGGYYDLLAPQAAQVDVWRTIYQHPHGVAGRDRRMGARHGAQALRRPPARRACSASYLAEYERRIAQAYPQRADGRLLLAFPRMFIVAQRKQAHERSRCRSSPRRPARRPGRRRLLPVCDHYSGVEARMRKSLQLQAEMTEEFGACVFDVTLDCEDGAPVGGEAEHAALVVELALQRRRPAARRRARAPGRPSRVRSRHRHHRRPGRRTA